VTERRDHAAPRSAEADFYDAHAWCLNPVLSVREQRERLRETWERLRTTDIAWQQEECWINLYLLLCSLDCTVSDYLAYRPWRRDGGAGRGSRASQLASGVLSVANAPYEMRALRDKRHVRQWKGALDRCVEAVCRALVDRASGGRGDPAALERDLPEVLSGPLPRQPAEWRMRIPEAFRCQDLTHHDVIAMAARFAAAHSGDKGREVFVVGPRTAGAYFAPLVRACLRCWGFHCTGWVSIRPKEGLSKAERRTLASAGTREARVLIVMTIRTPETPSRAWCGCWAASALRRGT
jgi:hypothetical protein